jgi:hypothetical protein
MSMLADALEVELAPSVTPASAADSAEPVALAELPSPMASAVPSALALAAVLTVPSVPIDAVELDSDDELAVAEPSPDELTSTPASAEEEAVAPPSVLVASLPAVEPAEAVAVPPPVVSTPASAAADEFEDAVPSPPVLSVAEPADALPDAVPVPSTEPSTEALAVVPSSPSELAVALPVADAPSPVPLTSTDTLTLPSPPTVAPLVELLESVPSSPSSSSSLVSSPPVASAPAEDEASEPPELALDPALAEAEAPSPLALALAFEFELADPPPALPDELLLEDALADAAIAVAAFSMVASMCGTTGVATKAIASALAETISPNRNPLGRCMGFLLKSVSVNSRVSPAAAIDRRAGTDLRSSGIIDDEIARRKFRSGIGNRALSQFDTGASPYCHTASAVLRAAGVAQRAPRPRQARHHRADGQVQPRRRLVIGRTGRGDEQHHLALSARQLRQIPPEVAQFELQVRRAFDDQLGRGFVQRQYRALARLQAQPVGIGVAQGLKQISPRILDIAQMRQRAQQAVLRQILGIHRPPQHRPGAAAKVGQMAHEGAAVRRGRAGAYIALVERSYVDLLARRHHGRLPLRYARRRAGPFTAADRLFIRRRSTSFGRARVWESGGNPIAVL